jgi:hypothetical protein
MHVVGGTKMGEFELTITSDRRLGIPPVLPCTSSVSQKLEIPWLGILNRADRLRVGSRYSSPPP